ncbi:MAG: NAD-glutamate dehydrogenase [Rickettsiaceae bacterium]|nr:NAD-glutamate dehydrogenase [Rickettsiaceae bacterium]
MNNHENINSIQPDSSWYQDFSTSLASHYDDKTAKILAEKYSDVFPTDFQYKYKPSEASSDVAKLERLWAGERIIFDLVQKEEHIVLKLFSSSGKLSLSDIMPKIENFGFIVNEEQRFLLNNNKDFCIHLYFIHTKENIENFELVKKITEDALYSFFDDKTISDNFSALITCSLISWRDVDLIRAMSHYMHQIGINFDYKYMSQNLIKYSEFTKNLIKLFYLKFSPSESNAASYSELVGQMQEYLSSISVSTEDRVLRTFLGVIDASIRTNFFQINEKGESKPYISIKFNSKKVPSIPEPVPFAEIFVFAKDFEAIHLRGGKVARGGIRWSDRGEDYRTEVLGLMKAQMTKNTVIVPEGSKGGFFVKFNAEELSSEQYQKKAVECYQNFLRGLLDITDNITPSGISSQENTIIHDDQDPYLVVAADKGTATFSDFANQVSTEYNFWLGDAFASGGSAGYDHKKMAITAKGAWISVQRHFRELGKNPEKDEITAIGIGDMSGDVFGNGLLMSKTIKLVAAFNHMHIFLDPNPDGKISFSERLRLFNIPGSKWSDYNKDLISKGGGVFERSAKTIHLSKEIMGLLETEQSQISPTDLIKLILKAKVDLLWNGGIGTYVKASFEENYAIGDKTNDPLRVNGSEIRARVIGEGGNLGMSQNGRIEYARSGGKVNTDFIDNSAGVDCSDHEVNIKIALSKAIAQKTLSVGERNDILGGMTSEVSSLVLEDNILQTLAITFMEHSSLFNMETFIRLIGQLESSSLLNRAIEFLPSNQELISRNNLSAKLTRPELSVILSYTKRAVRKELENSKIISEEYFSKWLLEYFPVNMRERFKQEILEHPLRKEIILTVMTNKLVNELSGPVINVMQIETGCEICDIARGFVIVQEIFNIASLWKEIDNLPSTVPLNIAMEVCTDINKVIRRGISWMISNLATPMNIEESIKKYKESAIKISEILTKNLQGPAKDKYDSKYKKYIKNGFPDDLAEKSAKLDSLVSSFDIAFMSQQTGESSDSLCRAYFAVANIFNIDYLRKICDKLMTDSYWQRLSIQSIKDDLYDKQRRIVGVIVRDKMLDNVDNWYTLNQKSSGIYLNFVETLKIQENIDVSMLILATKKLETFIRKK